MSNASSTSKEQLQPLNCGAFVLAAEGSYVSLTGFSRGRDDGAIQVTKGTGGRAGNHPASWPQCSWLPILCACLSALLQAPSVCLYLSHKVAGKQQAS